MTKTLNVVDLYCGAGGLSWGFANAVLCQERKKKSRYKIVFGVDHNPDAIRTYRQSHFAHLSDAEQQIVAPCTDIVNITAETIRTATNGIDIDVVIGGPNCQGVSAAGLRNPDDNRNEMLLRFIGLVRDLRPKWFVMENVPGLTHTNNRDLLEAIFCEFEAIPGYNVAGDVLLAADYGVPQLRYRLFIIGTSMGRQIKFPNARYKSPIATDSVNLPPYETVGRKIRDLEDKKPRFYDEDDAISNPRDSNNHYCVRTEDLNVKRISSILQGEDWRSMPISLLPERYFATRISDQKGAYGRLSWDWPAYTITNEASNVTAGPFTHPSQNRSISVRESARLQSFPDECVFYGNVLSQYTQIGNAVPPCLAAAVAEAILFCDEGTNLDDPAYRPGRLNQNLLQDVRANRKKFPVLTPRIVNPKTQRLGKKVPSRVANTQDETEIQDDTWNILPRPSDPYPDQIETLRRLSQQPQNFKATKRALAILQFIEGSPKEEIVATAKTGEDNVRKWVNGYYTFGLDGWRAYSTPTERIANHDPDLTLRLEIAIDRAREFNFERETVNSEIEESKRLHMNPYITDLKEKFGTVSVRDLLGRFEEKYGYGVGTVYVSDLLAICDVVFNNEQ